MKNKNRMWRVMCCNCAKTEDDTKLYQSEKSGLIWCKECISKLKQNAEESV